MTFNVRYFLVMFTITYNFIELNMFILFADELQINLRYVYKYIVIYLIRM